jgi:predicted metal-dependent hydrolase
MNNGDREMTELVRRATVAKQIQEFGSRQAAIEHYEACLAEWLAIDPDHWITKELVRDITDLRSLY